MDVATFEKEVGRVFQQEWRSARRRAIRIAFAVGLVLGCVIGFSVHAEGVTKLWGG